MYAVSWSSRWNKTQAISLCSNIKNHRDRSTHIQRECLAVFTFAKPGCFVKHIKYFYFFTTQILGAVAADLLYKSVPGLCLIISRAARYHDLYVKNGILFDLMDKTYYHDSLIIIIL